MQEKDIIIFFEKNLNPTYEIPDSKFLEEIPERLSELLHMKYDICAYTGHHNSTIYQDEFKTNRRLCQFADAVAQVIRGKRLDKKNESHGKFNIEEPFLLNLEKYKYSDLVSNLSDLSKKEIVILLIKHLINEKAELLKLSEGKSGDPYIEQEIKSLYSGYEPMAYFLELAISWLILSLIPNLIELIKQQENEKRISCYFFTCCLPKKNIEVSKIVDYCKACENQDMRDYKTFVSGKGL